MYLLSVICLYLANKVLLLVYYYHYCKDIGNSSRMYETNLFSRNEIQKLR